MHIPDNYLSPSTCATLFVAMTPIWYYSIRKINKTLSADKIPLIGIGGAFAFILMMFNLPIPDGTTAHAVGGTLIALLLGPYAACIAISVALFIQAIIFGDGGILSFGANCFNIAFILPFTGFFIYKILNKIHLSPFYHKCTIFLSAYISINLAAFFTALELGIQPLLFVDNLGQPLYCPYPLWISIPAMSLSHLTIAGIAEGLFTLSLYLFILKTSPNIIYDSQQIKLNSIFSLLAFLIIISPIGLIAEGTAWGEWAPEEILNDTSSGVSLGFIPEKLLNGFNYEAFFPDYTMNGTTDILAYIASAIIGVALLIIIFKILGSIIYAKKQSL